VRSGDSGTFLPTARNSQDGLQRKPGFNGEILMAKSIAQRLSALEKSVAQFIGLGPAKKKAKAKRKSTGKAKAKSTRAKPKAARKKKAARRRSGAALPFPPG
jgi:hypothetical protein